MSIQPDFSSYPCKNAPAFLDAIYRGSVIMFVMQIDRIFLIVTMLASFSSMQGML
jgi:hypothetical protein